jgi:HEAT repeat protein
LSNKPPPDLDSRRTTRRSGPVRQQAPRTRLAAKIERVLATAINGDPRVVLDVKASEVLAEAGPVGEVITAAIERAGMGLAAQLTVTQTFLRSGLEEELLDSLASSDPAVRIAGARVCGALRLPDAVPWLADMLDDPVPAVREVAARALGRAGGRRVVDALMAHADRLPQYRVAKELSRAASDIDFEALLRDGGSAGTTVTVLMACGLRGDALRTPLLVRMAQDRLCDTQIRVAACRALAMIGDPAGADALRLLGTDPDAVVQKAAVRARMRISAATRKRIS